MINWKLVPGCYNGLPYKKISQLLNLISKLKIKAVSASHKIQPCDKINTKLNKKYSKANNVCYYQFYSILYQTAKVHEERNKNYTNWKERQPLS